jgi:hypothetical protein
MGGCVTGRTLSNDDPFIALAFTGTKFMMFNQKLGTYGNYMCGQSFHSGGVDGTDLGVMEGSARGLTSLMVTSYKQFHENFCHTTRDHLKSTLCYYNGKMLLPGDEVACGPCGVAKGRRVVLNHEFQPKATVVGERFFLDNSSVDKSSIGGSKCWALVVDDFSYHVRSFFTEEERSIACY